MKPCVGCSLSPKERVSMMLDGYNTCCNSYHPKYQVEAMYDGFYLDETKGYKAHIFIPLARIVCPGCGKRIEVLSWDCSDEGYVLAVSYALHKAEV